MWRHALRTFNTENTGSTAGELLSKVMQARASGVDYNAVLEDTIRCIEASLEGEGGRTQYNDAQDHRLQGGVERGEEGRKGGLSMVKNVEVFLRGFDGILVDAFSQFCINTARNLGATVPGRSALATRIERWSILSSPHVHKTAWTQLERRTHRRSLRLYDLHPTLVPRYVWYLEQHAPPDVHIECHLYDYCQLPESFRKE